MARKHEFLITMTVQDDDQTDPEDMVDIIRDVLEVRPGAGTAYRDGILDTIEDQRPKFEVKHLPFGVFALKIVGDK